MRLVLTLIFVGILAIGLACQKATSQSTTQITNQASAQTNTADEAPRISLEDAKKDFDNGTAIFVDSRPNDQYKSEHIKGAINVPFADAETRWKEIPTDKKIIVYCS
jgi:3-mercaptopyruvate sulfurtransferase SseA